MKWTKKHSLNAVAAKARKRMAGPDFGNESRRKIRMAVAGLEVTELFEGTGDGVAEVYDEMRQAMHAAINGITWERLEKNRVLLIHVYHLKIRVAQSFLMMSLLLQTEK